MRTLPFDLSALMDHGPRYQKARHSEEYQTGCCPLCCKPLVAVLTRHGPQWLCGCEERSDQIGLTSEMAIIAEKTQSEQVAPIGTAAPPAVEPVAPPLPSIVPAGHCRHCGRDKVNRPRGLCWVCFYTPGVRDLYPSTSKFARRGVGIHAGGRKAPEPTDALPATEAKVSVLEERARQGLALWNPLDRQAGPREAIPQGDRKHILTRQNHGKPPRPYTPTGNARAVLSVLRVHGALTRPELMEVSPVPAGSLSDALHRLLSRGLVERDGERYRAVQQTAAA